MRLTAIVVFLAGHLSLLADVNKSDPGPSGPCYLWYRNPGINWNEALPIGNGRMGAMVFIPFIRRRGRIILSLNNPFATIWFWHNLRPDYSP